MPSLINRIKKVLLEPTKFFGGLKNEKGVENAFLYLLMISLISISLMVLMYLLFNEFSVRVVGSSLGLAFPNLEFNFISFSLMLIVSYGAGALFSFVSAGLLHIWILIFGGKGDYSKTYQLYVYSRTPRYLLGWIPVVGFIIWIYNLVLLIIGTQKLHGISKGKSVLMYVLPLLVSIIAVISLMGFLMGFFISAIGAFQAPPLPVS